MSKPARTYVVGANPPQEVSDKAKKQLSSTKPSKKAATLMAKAATANVIIRSSCTGCFVSKKADETSFKGIRKEK